MPLITKFTGWEFTHRILWDIASEHARRAERDREWRDDSLVAMVFASHTVEAYVNFAGEHLAPDIWKDERNYFRRKPYRGWDGKLKKVLELANVERNPDTRPQKTIAELRALRDFIGHGKSERFEGSVVHGDDVDVPYPLSKLTLMITPKDRLQLVMADVDEFIQQLHRRVALHVDDHFFKASALGGPNWYVSRDTTAV